MLPVATRKKIAAKTIGFVGVRANQDRKFAIAEVQEEMPTTGIDIITLDGSS